jgi:hypothetical protein
MAWQSHKDKRKRKREKEQLVARTTLMITEKAFVCGLDSKCVQLILLVFIFDFLKK